jgi:hypothetical protein
MGPKPKRESFGGRISAGSSVRGSRGRIPRRKSALAREPPAQPSRKVTGKPDPPPRHCDLVRTINSFLQQKCKVTPFPAKGSLDLKHYRNAATSLLKVIDPNFPGFSQDKFHNEFRELLEIMGYPFMIRPSDFQSFGAQHRLAAALDPLYWLTELLRIDDNPQVLLGDQHVIEDQ